MGYTPDVVCGVWVGNDDNSKGSLTGGTVPALIWKDVMLAATEQFGNHDFEYPQVYLEAFKAKDVKVIDPNDAKKFFETKDDKDGFAIPQLELPKVDLPKINISLPGFKKNSETFQAVPISKPQPQLQQIQDVPVPTKSEAISVPSSDSDIQVKDSTINIKMELNND